jgi:uncharacterized membrane protein
MATLSTAAWIAHDLGIATGVGGSLFGRMALHPAVRHVSDREERGQVVNDAWMTFSGVQLTALGIMAVSWFAGRSKLSGREFGKTPRALVLAKDAFVSGSLLTAIGTSYFGRKLGEQRTEGRIPMDDDGSVGADAPVAAQKLERVVDTLGIVNLICGAGVIATTAILAMKAGQSTRWSAISRLLP